MSSNWYVYAIGFLGQLLFAGRLIMQWLKSEKKEKIATPSLFWKLSLQGAVLLFVYGYLRDDMAIMLGQFLVYGAYFRNLQLQGKWGESGVMFKIYVICLPILIALYLLFFGQMDWEDLIKGDNISTWLIALGIVGQLIYTFRFIYQWVYAEKHQKSDLPWKFWVISLVGSSLIFTYGIFRDDPVLIAAHFFGGMVYIRNLFIIRKSQAKA